ncbi:MAG: NUDIX domain-containing protein [Christensenellaceae bacterium]|nr:NUDIX domain-containing protein [Christensenellaceae bacterium]
MASAKYCRVFPLDTFPVFQYVVIFSRMNGRWLFSRHRQRQTWETQGGHIEPGETSLEAAKRELYEESGAKEFTIVPVCDYWAGNDTGSSVGAVFLAEITELGDLPDSEMAEVRAFDTLPDAVTYPAITPMLFEEIKAFMTRASG